ncbi:MAG: hypothetical protein COB07_12415 [Sulfurovum sp.]|nr:MAG: hypothetical protein COB07_12415 [Sulfurovum sp.]
MILQTRFVDEEISLRFGKFAYEIISSERKTYGSASQYAKLSRAILPINKEDARAYFEMAMEANSTLGEDARDRLHILFHISGNINSSTNM